MADPSTKQSREQRLAAKLRENLRRRKAQAKALDGGQVADGGPAADGDGNIQSKPPLPTGESKS